MRKRHIILLTAAALVLIGAVHLSRPAPPPVETTSIVGLTEEEARARLGEPCHSVADYPTPGKKALAFDRNGAAPLVLYFGESGRVEKVTSQGQEPR